MLLFQISNSFNYNHEDDEDVEMPIFGASEVIGLSMDEMEVPAHMEEWEARVEDSRDNFVDVAVISSHQLR